ncbi:MAG: hypothetical protein GXP33_04835 [Spirochaetes bacterium]|nr:hypothetical protein [Spirochaetota bacterium]
MEAALIFSGIEYNNLSAEKSRILYETAVFKRFMQETADGQSSGKGNTKQGNAGDGGNTAQRTEPGAAGIKLDKTAAEKILKYLHRHIFKKYMEKQTRIDVVFRDGTYNCVSSAVIYMFFAKSLGFRVKGVRTKDHAFCSISAGGRDYDVETTSPYGFDPGEKKIFTDQFGRTTGYTYVPPGNYRDRSTISDRQMLGLILYNRNAFLTTQRDFISAIGPAVDAYALLKDTESMNRLAVSLNNAASMYGITGNTKRGIEFLKRSIEIYGKDEIGNKLKSNLSKLYNNYVIGLINRKKYDDAFSVLHTKDAEMYLHRDARKKLVVYLYQVRAKAAAGGSAYLRAAAILEKGIRETGRDYRLLRNYAVYVHNAAVEKIKSGDYRAAEMIINEGLKLVPDSAVMRKDAEFIRKEANR